MLDLAKSSQALQWEDFHLLDDILTAFSFLKTPARCVVKRMEQIFRNRLEAGQLLAEQIRSLPRKDLKNAILLALPRGGVPIASEISKKTGIPFDILIVRKIGHPRHSEYGIGALAEEDFEWMDPEAVGLEKTNPSEIQLVIEKERSEIERRIQKYRGDRTFPSLARKTVILVDDGLATGVTARVAIEFAREKGAEKVVLAVPVCSERTAERMRSEVDELICLEEPARFYGVGQFYHDFEQLEDEDILKLLPSTNLKDLIAEHAKPLRSRMDLAPLVQKLSDAKIVMLGESSHGTQEFYEWRRYISQELIAKHSFNFIAVEGDWPPSSALNDFIQSNKKTDSTRNVLRHFHRWPTWMWANTEMIKLAHWMKEHNASHTASERVHFFGLDVYSLFESMDEVIRQLQKLDPLLARRVQVQYECFESFERNEKSYAKHLIRFPEGCERQVLNVLHNVLEMRLSETLKHTPELFDAEQNARIVKNAEDYYRTMVLGGDQSWNVRDRHMTETLEILLRRFGPDSKCIVWAHNTHVGDYRATDMIDEGEINIGGLAREKWGSDQVALVGFGTYQGEVLASRAWDGPTQVMTVPPGQKNSYESHFHEAAQKLQENAFYLWLKNNPTLQTLTKTLGHRAIGVVYNPAYERFGNYVPTSLARRYDAFLFFDRTRALTPLIQKFDRNEIPETWPRGV